MKVWKQQIPICILCSVVLSACSTISEIEQTPISFYPSIERALDSSRSIIVILESSESLQEKCKRAELATLYYRMINIEDPVHASFTLFSVYSIETGSLLYDMFPSSEFMNGKAWVARLFLTGISRDYEDNDIVEVKNLDFTDLEARIVFEKMGAFKSKPVCVMPPLIFTRDEVIALLTDNYVVEVDKFRSKSVPFFYLKFVQP